jgi:uncharacterized protein (DUF305 family)
MKASRSKAIMFGASLTLAGLLLSGCTINIGTSQPRDDHNMMGHSSGNSEYSGMDIMFAQMMIPHHQQAIEMSTLASSRAYSQEVATLAAEILAEQQPEIDQMKLWLKAANASEDMGHEMGMGGMLTDAQMKQLEAASGEEFDRLFLEGMILHHRGAIQMAQMVIGSANSEVKALAEAIVESQTSQIQYMESLLAG